MCSGPKLCPRPGPRAAGCAAVGTLTDSSVLRVLISKTWMVITVPTAAQGCEGVDTLIHNKWIYCNSDWHVLSITIYLKML